MRVEPSTDRGRATVERVLDAACVLFARQGVRATTLDQVGTRAQAGRGQLYHFFTGKPDLVVEVVSRQVERVLGAQQPLLGTISTADDVRAWCQTAVRLHEHTEDPIRCPIGTLVHELGEDDPAARATLAAGFRRWQGLLAAGLERVDARGELVGGADPLTVATGLLAAYQGGTLLADALGDIEPLRVALQSVTAPVLLGTLCPSGRARLVRWSAG